MCDPDNSLYREYMKTVETVTQDEYFREVSTLNGKIRELEQKLQAEQQKNSKQKEDTVEFLRKSEACLDAVSAMLECSGGATHERSPRQVQGQVVTKFQNTDISKQRNREKWQTL